MPARVALAGVRLLYFQKDRRPPQQSVTGGIIASVRRITTISIGLVAMTLVLGLWPRPRTHLRILTYNVLSNPDGDPARWPALFEILASSTADIVCLQEVEPKFLYELHQQPWFFANYQSPQWQGFHAFPNGNYIYSRYPITAVEVVTHMNSRQRRRSLVVTVRAHGEEIAIATCHLESPLDDGPRRAEQMREVFATLAAAQTAIFAGDFNFGDGEQPETAALDASYTDLWVEKQPGRTGYTWDIEGNPMAAAGSFVNEPSRRLDRILCRSERWEAVSMTILGNRPLSPGSPQFPSDHYGLLGVLQRVR